MNSPPTSVCSKWDLGSNQKSNSWRVLEEKVGGFKQGLFPAFHDGSYNWFLAEEKEMLVGFTPFQRSDVELLQNCDLPPPLKVFTGEKETITKIEAPKRQPSPPIKITETEEEAGRGFIDDRLSLLKALQLSQTRAREAEKAASIISSEKDQLTAMFFKESLQLFAHRRWFKLLEIEILLLQKKLAISHMNMTEEQSGYHNDNGDAGSTWCIAMAMCLGLAGVSFAIGYRYLL